MKKIDKTLEGAEIVDFVPLLTNDLCYFLVLARTPQGELRLIVHTLFDSNTEGCNAAFHYNIKKNAFTPRQSKCSDPLPMQLDAQWRITNAEVTNEDQIELYLSSDASHAAIFMSQELPRAKN